MATAAASCRPPSTSHTDDERQRPRTDSTGSSTIKGLVINRFGASGILITGTGGNTIIRNFIGVDIGGDFDEGNFGDGIYLLDSPNNQIGASGGGNVISGNDGDGVMIEGAASQNNIIQANFIGTNHSGGGAIPNDLSGVWVLDANGTLIGGAGTALGNVISGNDFDAIDIDNAFGPTTIQGNKIGTTAGGAALPNFGDGISIVGSAVVIGGSLAAANTIAFNQDAGVDLLSGAATIRMNSIHTNGQLGIDLGLFGVTLNDPLDSDVGPNAYQNFPLLGNITRNSTNTLINWRLQSTPGTTYNVDFYWSPTCDPSNYGEGKTYLASATGTTNGAGDTPFLLATAPLLAAGSKITATATDPNGLTSEFSRCGQVK